ncbi:hypothetical protein CROQUDRAFT_43128, partial [Cronartium quercuum f. sp. fusiforme G11]
PKPYSKSHAKRMKKKIKENGRIGNLDTVKCALAELATEPVVTPSEKKPEDVDVKRSKKSMSERGRAIVLLQESARLPKILEDSAFKKDPFGALRTHLKHSLQNT